MRMKIGGYGCAGVLAVGVLAGCGREPEAVTAPPENPMLAERALRVERPAAAVIPPPVAPEPSGMPGAVRVLSDEEAPIAVRAITEDASRGLRVGVVHKGSGRSVQLAMGDACAGYKLVGYDAVVDMAVFLAGGQRVGIYLSAAAPEVPAGVAGPGGGVADEGEMPLRVDRRNVETMEFEPLAMEVEQGIDPNAPETWTEDYRGPVIERLIHQQREAVGTDPFGP